MTKTTRTETDTFGPIEVDATRYWGAQAERSLHNFKIGWEKQPASVVRALGIVKRAAAETNMALGHLDHALVGHAERPGRGLVRPRRSAVRPGGRRGLKVVALGRGQDEGVRHVAERHRHRPGQAIGEA